MTGDAERPRRRRITRRTFVRGATVGAAGVAVGLGAAKLIEDELGGSELDIGLSLAAFSVSAIAIE